MWLSHALDLRCDISVELGIVGNGCGRLLLCSQPWPMLCITCCLGMCMGKCTRVHKISNRMMGLKAGQKLLLSTLTHINIFTRCDVNQEWLWCLLSRAVSTQKLVDRNMHNLRNLWKVESSFLYQGTLMDAANDLVNVTLHNSFYLTEINTRYCSVVVDRYRFL